jgi:CheY-like chemotaxis protein
MAVLKTLQSSAQTAHIPVIALSSDAFPKQIEAGMQAGYYAYLTKPYKIAALMVTIDSALQLLPQTH